MGIMGFSRWFFSSNNRSGDKPTGLECSYTWYIAVKSVYEELVTPSAAMELTAKDSDTILESSKES